MKNNIRSYPLATPLDSVQTARFEIDNGDGNMILDNHIGGDDLLVSGNLEYTETQGVPTLARSNDNGQTAFTLKAVYPGQAWFHLPWKTCNGATTWRVHLNPVVCSSVKALSRGGNLQLDFANSALTNLDAETGGGNIDIVLPSKTRNLTVILKTGGGNVTVHLPAGTAARIKATTGWGKVMMDPHFIQVDKFIYQSADYDRAECKVEITAASGAGNVIVDKR